MPQFSVRMEGPDQVRVGLNKFVKTMPVVTLGRVKATMERAMKRSVPYNGGNSYSVPERSYVRRGILGRMTTLEQNGATYTIKSTAPRSTYVIGNAQGQGQARVHVGWWTPMRTAVDFELESMLPEADRELQNSIEAAGL